MANSSWNRRSTTTDGLSPVRDLDYAYSAPLVRKSQSWLPATPAADEWKDEASCLGQDADMFEWDDNLSDDEQMPRIHEGMKICSGCPVRDLCQANSTPAESYWTVRGGRPPGGLMGEGMPHHVLIRVGVPGKSGTIIGAEPVKNCKRGHDDWRIRKDGHRECKSCLKIRNANRYKKKADQSQ